MDSVCDTDASKRLDSMWRRCYIRAPCQGEATTMIWIQVIYWYHHTVSTICYSSHLIFLFQTVKYFKSIEHVHQSLIGPHNLGLQGNLLRSMKDTDENVTKRRKLFLGTVLNTEEESPVSSDDRYVAKKNGNAGWKRKMNS